MQDKLVLSPCLFDFVDCAGNLKPMLPFIYGASDVQVRALLIVRVTCSNPYGESLATAASVMA